MSDEEISVLTGEIDSILGYVDQIKQADVSQSQYIVGPTNVMREDIPNHEKGQYTKDILASAPKAENDYLVVKKIL